MALSRRSHPLQAYGPVAYLLLALLLFVVALPSVLRPPPDQASTAAEFSPEAPQEEQQDSIVAALNRGSTGTAGLGSGAGLGDTPAAIPGLPPPPEVAPPRNCPGGFGDPPRQTESLYSAPCAKPFAGDNGGETWENVFATEVRIGVRQRLSNPPEACVPDQPRTGESGSDRTWRVLQAYLNSRYETYGRKVTFCGLADGGGDSDSPGWKASAQDADREKRLFAAYSLSWDFCQEFMRLNQVAFCNPMTDPQYREWSPNLFSYMANKSDLDRLLGEYACKRLWGKPADHAQSSRERGQTRKFAAVYWGGSFGGDHTPGIFQKAFADGCGGKLEDFVVTNESNRDATTAATTISKWRQAGVTTIVAVEESVSVGVLMAAADSVDYHPEWVIPSAYAIDLNGTARLMPATQMDTAFGFTQWELPRSAGENDCHRAYKEMDPGNTADGFLCGYIWPIVLQIVNGIQMAGPQLTPESFAQGLYKMGKRFYPKEAAAGGGFSPGDHSYPDDYAEIWYSTTHTPAGESSPGGWCYTNGAARFTAGDVPEGDGGLFRDCITDYAMLRARS